MTQLVDHGVAQPVPSHCGLRPGRTSGTLHPPNRWNFPTRISSLLGTVLGGTKFQVSGESKRKPLVDDDLGLMPWDAACDLVAFHQAWYLGLGLQSQLAPLKQLPSESQFSAEHLTNNVNSRCIMVEVFDTPFIRGHDEWQGHGR